MALIPSRHYHVRLDTDSGRYIVATGDPQNDYEIIGPLTKNAVVVGADGEEATVTAGALHIGGNNANPGAGEVKMIAAAIGATSADRNTLLTPLSGKRVRVISVAVASNSAATMDRISIWFGLGAEYLTVPHRAIHEGNTTADGSFSIVWPDGGGPLGLPDEVVSWTTETEADALINLTLVYREE